jgi:hypothetical protein
MKKPLRKNGGYALVTALIFFLTATTAVIAGLSDAIFREVRTVRNESLSKQSYFTSESALEDFVYRIKYGKQIDSSESLSISDSSAVASLTESEDGSQVVTSYGDKGGAKRSTQAVLEVGSGISFAYAIQSGIDGVDLAGASHVIGDIYTLGSIHGCGLCTISGEAIAAGKSTDDLDADNSAPMAPSNTIIFGDSNGTQDLAQSFTISGDDLSIIHLKMYLKKVGSPANATLKITTDNSGSPGNTILASGTISSSLINNSFGWIDITLTSNPILVSGTTYWIVLDASNNASNHYAIGANSSYAAGSAKIGKYGVSWSNTSPTGLDAYFQTFVGRNEAGITGESGVSRISIGSGYSYNASYVSSVGSLFCQTGTSNSKECDTSRADPVVLDYPVPTSKISNWKSSASASVYNDNFTVDSDGAVLGPKKIVGNLNVGGGGTLEISGTLWVTGNLNITGNSTVRPSGSTKSFVVIVDGTISLVGGSEILGNVNSHILLVSLSTSDPAISINGGADDTVVFAPYGGVFVSGGASVKAGSAKHISIDGGSNVTYDPSLADLNFSSGMANSSFRIKSWKEIE